MSKTQRKKGPDLERVLRQAVHDCGLTRYAVAKGAGVDVAALLRFLSGKRTLTLPSAAKLAAFLGLKLRPTKRCVGMDLTQNR